MADVVTVLSNGFFIIPCIRSCVLHRWTRAAVYFVMIFASSFYHVCNSWTGYCVLEATILRKGDFFFAQLLIVLTALYIVKFPENEEFIERWLIIGAAVVIFITEVATNEPFELQLAIAGVSLAMILIYWLMFALYTFRKEGRARFPIYDWDAFVLGVAFTAIACTLFATQQQWHLGYAWIHAVWHTCAAFGQYWILNTRGAGRRNAALDRRILSVARGSVI